MICGLCQGSQNLTWFNKLLGKRLWSICHACNGHGVFNPVGPAEIKMHNFKPGKWRNK